MTIRPEIREQIAITVIQMLKHQFSEFEKKTAGSIRNQPFHNAFLRSFEPAIDKLNPGLKIKTIESLKTWLHGFATSLGQGFFEKIAYILSKGEKRTFNGLEISRRQDNEINTIMSQYKQKLVSPNLQRENDLIFKKEDAPEMLQADPFTADFFIEEADSVRAIELKSVQPNKGEISGEKQKILKAKAALFNTYPNKKIEYFFGFPFDPTVDNGIDSNKIRFFSNNVSMDQFLAFDECLLAGELWDKLSGHPNTMSDILEIICAIATPDFLVNYNLIASYENYENPAYAELLDKWYLISEKEIFDNRERLRLSKSKQFYNSVFSEKGYNYKRYEALKKILDQPDNGQINIF